MFCSFDSRLQRISKSWDLFFFSFLILPSTGLVYLRLDMPDSKRGGRLLQLAVVLVALLSLCAELRDAAEVVVDTGDTEVVTKQTDTRASRAKRRGGTDVLRG